MEEFKKCERCGGFFISNDNVCCNCSHKDEYDMTKLKNYFEENNPTSSLEEISNNTGITIKNLGRYMVSDNFKNYANSLNDNEYTGNFNNLSINL